MKRMAILAAAVLGWCLVSGLFAEEPVLNPAPGSAAGANVAPGWGGGAIGAPGGFAGASVRPGGTYSAYGQMIKVCNLSEDQQTEIKEIEADRDKAAQAFYADNAERIKAAQAVTSGAYKNKDNDARQKAFSDYREIMAPLGDIQKRAQTQVMSVLAPEQRATWQEFQVFNNIKAVFGRAKLTEEQMARTKAAYAELARDKDAKAEDIIRKLSEQVRAMLTDEQKEAMKAPLRINIAPGGAPQPGAPAGGAWAPGASAGGMVIMIGEGSNGAGVSVQGTVVQEGAGSSVYVIEGQDGPAGAVEVRIEQRKE